MKKVEAAVMKFWRIVVLGIVGVVIFSRALNAGVGDWKNYTDMKSVRVLVSDGRYFWAGTSGGIFRFDPSDSSFLKFTNSEGLSSNNVTALTVDAYGNIWVGQFSGALDVYTPSTNTWRYVTDIAISAKNNKTINTLFASGDTLFIGTGFGIAVFSISKFEFRDSYSIFSTISQPSISAIQIYQKRIFAVSDKGIVASKVSATNLAAPESWDVISSVVSGNSISVSNDSLFIGTSQGILKFQNNSLVAATGSFPTRVLFSNNAIYFTDGRIVYSRSSAQTITQISDTSNSDITSGSINSSQKWFAGFSDQGLGNSDSPHTIWKYVSPNGPATNSFVSLAIDNSGTVWAASGRLFAKGFYSFNGTSWMTFSSSTNPAIPFNDSYKITLGSNNSKWISGTGGIIVLNADNAVVAVYDKNNPGFNTAGSRIDVLLFGGAQDASSNMWFTNFNASNNQVLWEMKTDKSWISVTNPSSYKVLMDMVIDNEGTKWFTNGVPLFNPNTTGGEIPEKKFVYYNETNSISGTSNGWGELTIEDGISSTNVLCLAIDKEGELWAGTNTGITIINSPRNPKSRLSKLFLGAVRDQYITCIAVDPLNNKWLGTPGGVFVVSPDGSLLLQQYTVESTNGKLVDNNVLSIAFDTKHGIVYFGTDKGLSSLEITAIQTSSDLKGLVVNPNPVYLDKTTQVELRGLVEESIVKVLTINGKLVKQFSAQGGGRAFWDCRDNNGLLVASGIYLFVAHSPAGDQVGTAKVAVIHR